MWELLGFIIGAVLGSFIKVLADRSLIPIKSGQTNSLFWGRSYCPHCKKTLQWYDLFPIFSYFFLGGRCRYCRKRIGKGYFVIEIATGLLVAFLFSQSFQNFNFQFSIFNFQLFIFLLDLIFKLFIISTLIALFLTDFKKMLIPDRISIPAIWIAATFVTVTFIIKVIYLYYFLSQSVIGRLLLPPHSDYFWRHVLITAESLFGSIIMGFLVGIFFLSLIIITKGKGMGGGDVKLGAFIGVALGFPGAILALVLAFLSGAIFSVSLIVLGKKHFGQTIAFGPFLVLGSLVTLFWGDQILNWYLKLQF